MINKALLKQNILDNRREIESYNIVHRNLVNKEQSSPTMKKRPLKMNME